MGRARKASNVTIEPKRSVADHPAQPRLQALTPQLLAGLAVFAGLATAALLRRASLKSTEPEWSPEMFAWPMAATLLCAPVVFPWYLLWLLPFLTSASMLLIIVWTVSITPTYLMWHWRALGRPWGALPGWVMLVEYGCLAAAAVITWWCQVRRA